MQVLPCNNLLRSLHPQVLVHHNKWAAPLAIKFQRLPKAVCSMCITRPTANSGLCVVIDIIATLRNQLVVNRASIQKLPRAMFLKMLIIYTVESSCLCTHPHLRSSCMKLSLLLLLHYYTCNITITLFICHYI